MGDLARTAGAEGTHLVLGGLIFYTVRQFRGLVDKLLQLQERITETNERLDQIDERITVAIAARIVTTDQLEHRVADLEHPPPGLG